MSANTAEIVDFRARCAGCGEPLGASAAAYCCDCDAVHHEECYRWITRCARPACGGLRYSRSPQGRGVEVVELSGAPPSRLAGRGDLGRLQRAPAPFARVVLDTAPPEEAPRKLRSFERRLLTGIGVALIVGAILPGAWGVAGAVVAVLAGIAGAMQLEPVRDRYFVVDGGVRAVLMHERGRGGPHWTRVVPFDEVAALRIRRGDRGQGPVFWLELDDRAGHQLDLTPPVPAEDDRCPESLHRKAELLATMTAARIDSRRATD